MEIRFDKTGSERKALVMAISEITGAKSEYLGAPGFAFSVGSYTITKDGTVDIDVRTSPEAVSSLLEALSDRGFVPENMPGFTDGNANGAMPADNTSEKAETSDTVSIELPSEGFSDAALDNLTKLVSGKAALIRRALGNDLAEGAGAPPVTHEDGKVRFVWFRFGMDADSIAAWSMFTAMLCETAKKQKRVILKEKPLDEGASEKFAMRCFLLKLGFIGDEYKSARKIILAGLSGDGSRKMNKAEGPQ